ncbi:hypothetical protein ES703_58205 [subsurface metagenome]
MKTIKNCVGQQLIYGLAIIFVLCGTWTRLQANETSTWIDIRLHPEQGVYSFSISGLKFNSNFMPLKEEKLVEKEPVKISFKQEVIDQNEFQHDITDKSVLGVVIGSDKERSELLFVKGWTIRLKNLQTIEAYIWSEKNVALKKENENSLYELPANKEFTIEIHANEIEAELQLPLNSFPQNNNPIKLIQKRALAESLIEYRLRQDAVKDGKCRISILFFFENAKKNIKVASMDVEPKKNEQGLWGTAVLPVPEDFWVKWRRLSKPVRAVAIVTNEDGTFALKIDTIFITRKKLSIIGGVLAVVLFLIIVRLVKRIPFSKKWDKDRYEKWDGLERGEKFFRFPLHFAVTPLGRYSISLAQILFWTVIVIFAFVYVAISRGEFLSITEQILILLGISGTTSIVSKAAAVARLREIPDEYMEDITKDRIPRFRDLFCIGDVPNIFKFQIFAFTLLAGSLVIRELLRSGNFPTLEQNLLTLMGISGGVYIANELATKNVWEKLQKLIDEHDKKKKEEDELDGLETKKTVVEKELVELIAALATRTTIPPDDPDKKREHELQDRIAKYKEKLATREKVEKKEGSLKNEILELLEEIYTEPEGKKEQKQQEVGSS